MSDATRESSRGLQTEAHRILLTLLFEELTPEAVCRVWNKYQTRENKALTKYTGATKTKQAGTFDDNRRVFKQILRESPFLDLVKFGDGGEMKLFGDDSPTPMVEEPTEEKPEEPLGPTLTEFERQILNAATPTKALKGIKPEVKLDASDCAEIAASLDQPDPMARAYEEEKRLKEERIFQTMETADRLLLEHQEKQGEALFNDAIRVVHYPSLDHRVVFVCSSTAPMFRTHGPNVKHDFRANDAAVTHKHPLAVKQANDMKVIRSKVIQKGGHEYYVKALQYEDGMVLKGYFVVDGVENPFKVPPRFYQIRGDKVVRITEAEYNTALNRLAARRG